jgi:subfamily B ATP-binding cassette protein MsbA
MDWKLALFSLLVIPPVVFFSSIIGSKLKKTSKALQEQNVKISQHLVDTLSGIVVVKAFGRENSEEKRFGDYLYEFLQRGMRDAKWQAVLSPAVKITNALFFCIIGWFALYRLTVVKDLSVATFIGFASVLVLFQATLQKIGAAFEKLSRAAVSLERIDEILSQTTRRGIRATGEIHRFKEYLEVKSLDFSYDAKPVIRDLNIKISRGQLVVFSGLSGAGKTTLIRILVGLLSPSNGNIYIDGLDLQTLDETHLRDLFSFVPQTTTLFNQTIHKNLTYGKPDAAKEDIIQASRLACAHEFIKNLPHGYDTHVGDMGEHLSAGQRQRITIARSLLKPAEIIVFDECLSNLDYITEQRIYSNLWNLRGETTMVLVTHRLSAVRSADCIYHLADGKIVESGTHEELMAIDGAYKHLYLMQEHYYTLTSNRAGSP